MCGVRISNNWIMEIVLPWIESNGSVNVNWFQFGVENSIKCSTNLNETEKYEEEGASVLLRLFIERLGLYGDWGIYALRTDSQIVAKVRILQKKVWNCKRSCSMIIVYLRLIHTRIIAYFCWNSKIRRKIRRNCRFPRSANVRRMNWMRRMVIDGQIEIKIKNLNWNAGCSKKRTTHMWTSFSQKKFSASPPLCCCFSPHRQLHRFFVCCLVVSFVSFSFSILFHFTSIHSASPSPSSLFLSLNVMCIHALIAIKAHKHTTRHYDWSNDIVNECVSDKSLSALVIGLPQLHWMKCGRAFRHPCGSSGYAIL